MIKNVALASLIAASAVMAQQDAGGGLRIETPNGPVSCQPTRITWGGGQAPYYVTIMKGGESAGTPLADLTGGQPTDETSLTWWVNLEPGTEITATIKDSTGQQNAAAKVTVADGGNKDCLQKPLSVSIAGAMATPSGSSNGETPQATPSSGGEGGGGGAAVVPGGQGGGDQQQSQGGGDQASQTPSASGAEQSGAEQSGASQSGAEQSGASQSGASQSATPTGGAGGAAQSSASASGASQSGASASGGNAASSVQSKASSATGGSATPSGAQPSGGNAGSGASALIPGFVAPALAAVVAVFAL